MRWDYFKVYKQIRKNKHLSQTQVAGQMMTRQAVAAFEDGKSIPKFDNMEHLLRQLDVTFDEFQHICDYYQPNDRKKIITQFKQLNSLTSKEHIESLIKQCQDYLESNEDIPIQRRLMTLQLYLATYDESYLGESELSQSLFDSIWQELSSYDEWYLGDLHLLVAILPLFPIDTLVDTADEILASLKRYEDYANITEARFSILSNLATTFLYKGHAEKALSITKLTIKTAQYSHRSDYLGFCWVRLGLLQEERSLIQRGLDLLELAEEGATLAYCQREISHFLPDFFEIN